MDVVARPRGERDRALAGGRQKLRRVEHRRRRVGEAEALQPGEREQRRIDRAGVELGETRLHVAAQKGDREVRPQPLDERGAAQRGGADDRARRQVARMGGAPADPHVAHVLARQIAGERDRVRQHRRQILGRMDGEIDRAVDQRGVELLGEQALAAGLPQSPVLDRIARGANDDDRRRGTAGRMGGEQTGDGLRLRQRERAAARADP